MISKSETTKDTVQVLTESAANHVGRIATIITAAVRDIAREMGEWATDAFEMRDAANRATRDDVGSAVDDIDGIDIDRVD